MLEITYVISSIAKYGIKTNTLALFVGIYQIRPRRDNKCSIRGRTASAAHYRRKITHLVDNSDPVNKKSTISWETGMEQMIAFALVPVSIQSKRMEIKNCWTGVALHPRRSICYKWKQLRWRTPVIACFRPSGIAWLAVFLQSLYSTKLLRSGDCVLRAYSLVGVFISSTYFRLTIVVPGVALSWIL